MNHKFWNAGTGKPEDVVHAVKNVGTVVIPAGTPAVFAMNGTDDGLAVVLPSNSTAANVNAFTAGIVVKTIQPGALGEVQVYGFNRRTLIARATRATPTDAWPTMASMAMGAVLNVDTGLNGGASSGGQTLVDPYIFLAESMTAGPTLPSSNVGMGGSSATVYYYAAKTFLRFM